MAETHIGRSHGHAFEKCSADLQVMLLYVNVALHIHNNLYVLGVIIHACVELHNKKRAVTGYLNLGGQVVMRRSAATAVALLLFCQKLATLPDRQLRP